MYTDDSKNYEEEFEEKDGAGNVVNKGRKEFVKTKRMYPYFMLKTRYRMLVIGFFLVSFPFTLIGNPLSVALYYEGNAKTAGGEKANLTGPRALFLGCAAVYIYCIVSGIGMFLLAWRTKTFGNPQQTTA
ncbi:hypothetical protein IWQ57_003050 [Coemansia nantahalensis]|uniref:Uncharacterized protein n=1 Tax=Coemansia nantahalensis TaxID=2789366 RepID=A0ACC1JY74_9FUNG|nr:hypothetical protein IWQ57_003050 [Coemansia nantahalensis]